jgi:hypothetical protein
MFGSETKGITSKYKCVRIMHKSSDGSGINVPNVSKINDEDGIDVVLAGGRA